MAESSSAVSAEARFGAKRMPRSKPRMTPEPSTVRPSARLEAMVKRMRERDLTNLPVTTSDGRLVGLLLREDAERALAKLGRDR